MRSVKLIAENNVSTGRQEAPKPQAMAKKPTLVPMGSALEQTRGIGRGWEFGGYPKGF